MVTENCFYIFSSIVSNVSYHIASISAGPSGDSKALMQAIFSSLPLPVVEQENSTNLGEGEDSSNKNVKAILNQISPVQYFLEVCS